MTGLSYFTELSQATTHDITGVSDTNTCIQHHHKLATVCLTPQNKGNDL